MCVQACIWVYSWVRFRYCVGVFLCLCVCVRTYLHVCRDVGGLDVRYVFLCIYYTCKYVDGDARM